MCTSRIQGPIPAPSQTNNLQLIKFWLTPAITHSRSVIHDTSPNFDLFGNRKAGTQCQNGGINIASPKFEPLLIYIYFFLDICMQYSDTVQTDPQISSESAMPRLLRPPKLQDSQVQLSEYS